MIGYVVTVCAIVAVVMGAVWALSQSSDTTFRCVTHGANLVQSTRDNGLHITIWCVKDGKVVQ